VLDLHRKLEAGVLSRKGLELTDKLFGVARSRSTVSLVEARTTRGTVEIINTTSTTYYKMISENPEKWLLPGEQLGSRPTQVYGPKEVGERPPRQAIHAEELGVNDARALGARSGRVASSNLGCDEQCVSLLREEFPGFRHLNPERPGTQPPPVPEAVADAAAKRGVAVGSRAVPDLTSPAASRATGAAAFGEEIPQSARAGSALGRSAGAVTEAGEGGIAGSRVVIRAGTTLTRALTRAALAEIALVGLAIIIIVLDFIAMLEEQRREKALRDEIERTLRSKLPARLRTLMSVQGADVTEYLLSRWGRPGQLFLYASPLLDITSQPGTDDQKYRFKVEFNTEGHVSVNSVTHDRLTPTFVEHSFLWDSYYAQFRSSVAFPLLTPLDVYLAYLDVISEMFSRTWWAAAARKKKKLSSTAQHKLAEVADYLSRIASLLQMDHYAGFGGTNPFSEGQAVADRKLIIRDIYDLIMKKAAPLAEALGRAEIITSRYIILSPESSVLHDQLSRLIESADEPISPSLRRLASNLAAIPDDRLRYQRRSGVNTVEMGLAPDRYRDEYFRKITAEVREQLPKEYQWQDFDLSQTAGELRLEPFAEVQ